MVVDQPNSIDELHDMERNVEHDEIAAYLNCRYISDWLYIYQSSKGYTIEKVKNLQQLRASTRNTQNTHLTAWFELNSNDESAHHLLYPEIPKHHYVFNHREKKWFYQDVEVGTE